MNNQRHSWKYTVEQRVVRLRRTHGFGFWQLGGKRAGAESTGVLRGATVAHGALGPKCLLTD